MAARAKSEMNSKKKKNGGSVIPKQRKLVKTMVLESILSFFFFSSIRVGSQPGSDRCRRRSVHQFSQSWSLERD
ncbi:hypothetical protein LINPERPRIM_LOCUS4259 [Linum perenne]